MAWSYSMTDDQVRLNFLWLSSDMVEFGYEFGLVFEAQCSPSPPFRFGFCFVLVFVVKVSRSELSAAPAGPLPSFSFVCSCMRKATRRNRRNQRHQENQTKRTKKNWAVNHLASSCPVKIAGQRACVAGCAVDARAPLTVAEAWQTI